MADDVIIRAEGLGKKYVIGHQSTERYTALRDVMSRTAKNFARNTRDMLRGNPLVMGDELEEFWPLKNVSFEIKRGDVVGIIGRNGAGKSTLLKVISRITEPTEGRVTINGRVASLLEVGTGFHPELTGRENIFLNGAILGMSRLEIQRKFEEIVAFAEIEKFLDTPVKRYSSGMYVRLAFAVAAHLSQEVLIIDEVLAVGDAEFQRKCLGKMKDIATSSGRTVLFVSHNMAAVQAICTRAILLDQGRISLNTAVSDVVEHYLQSSRAAHINHGSTTLSKTIVLSRLEAEPAAARREDRVKLTLEVEASAEELITDIALLICSSSGQRVAIIDLRSEEGAYRVTPGKTLIIKVKVAQIPFVEADYSLGLWINSSSVCDLFTNLRTFTILPTESKGGVVPREPEHRGYVELHTLVETTLADGRATLKRGS
jgi:lipopolysaccharide transport system ATP-binding protein